MAGASDGDRASAVAGHVCRALRAHSPKPSCGRSAGSARPESCADLRATSGSIPKSVLEVKPQPVPRSARSGPQAALSIAEAARRTGVSVHTLRYYEHAGLVVTPVRHTHGVEEVEPAWTVQSRSSRNCPAASISCLSGGTEAAAAPSRRRHCVRFPPRPASPHQDRPGSANRWRAGSRRDHARDRVLSR